MIASETGKDRMPESVRSAPAPGGPVTVTLDSLPGESSKTVSERSGPRQPKPALLVDIAADTLTLHTRDAYWLFAGRGLDEDGVEHPILGGQRASAILNALRHIAIGGNPYADWFLVCFDDQLRALRAGLAQRVAEWEASIEALKRKGLALNVLGSREPLQLKIAFGSCYGYAIAETVVEFDYYVRIVRTLALKNRIRPDVGRAAIREISRPLRRIFARSMRWERLLRSPALIDIHRNDFLQTADEAARERVRAAGALVGAIPRSVLDGAMVPSHVARRNEAATEGFVIGSRPAGTADDPTDSLDGL